MGGAGRRTEVSDVFISLQKLPGGAEGDRWRRANPAILPVRVGKNFRGNRESAATGRLA
jgi:hypothetical protein